MLKGFSHVFKGLGGEFEINRVVGAFGAAAYIVGAHAFLGWDVIHLGHPFDVTAYCLAFPAGLGVAVGAIASDGSRDRAGASAMTEKTAPEPKDWTRHVDPRDRSRRGVKQVESDTPATWVGRGPVGSYF
jgi:hypothetical protein